MSITPYLPELSQAEMYELLDVERVGRLGLNDEPQPYVVPTDFAFKDGAIYIHSPLQGKKTALARKNPHVCFEVDRYNGDVTEYKSVIIRGEIREVLDEAEKRDAMRQMAKKATRSGGWKAHANGGSMMSAITIFKITIKEMTGIKSPNGGHP
jgi:uncharacterized protein